MDETGVSGTSISKVSGKVEVQRKKSSNETLRKIKASANLNVNKKFAVNKGDFPSLGESSLEIKTEVKTSDVIKDFGSSYSDKLKLFRESKPNEIVNKSCSSTTKVNLNIPSFSRKIKPGFDTKNKTSSVSSPSQSPVLGRKLPGKFPGHKRSNEPFQSKSSAFSNQKANDIISTKTDNIKLKYNLHNVYTTNEGVLNHASHCKSNSSNAAGNNVSQKNYSNPKKSGLGTNSPATTASLEGNKKKKNRKSKVKRQAAMQSGKIMVLSQEAHSKITGQTSTPVDKAVPRYFNMCFNNCEEYPELGTEPSSKSSGNVPHIRKEFAINDSDSGSNIPLESKDVQVHKSQNVMFVPSDISTSDVKGTAGESIDETEKSVHTKDPITISLFDMLKSAAPKKKGVTKSTDAIVDDLEENAPEKVKMKIPNKKATLQAINPLDSSRPSVRRGKERENPKKKRPTKMKKLILLERQVKRGTATLSNENTDTKIEQPPDTTTETPSHPNSTPDYDDSFVQICCGKTPALNTNQPTKPDNETSIQLITEQLEVLELQSSKGQSPKATSEVKELQITEEQSSKATSEVELQSNIEQSPKETSKVQEFLVDTDLCRSMDKDKCSKAELSRCLTIMEECLADIRWLFKHQEEPEDSKEGCVAEIEEEERGGSVKNMTENNSEPSSELKPSVLKKDFTEKDKADAMKILFHSRKFRKYCNMFQYKELDDTVFALIDDLARFQDRLHQKDPDKARAKRRLIYGIREIKKHMKLKKLKGIIVATDIEDIRTDGGLNDVVNEIVSLAEAYHIPVIFSHKRFNLGKICRKGVPISCVGIFNYGGSEKNFKHILDLLDQGKQEYSDLSRLLSSRLTQDELSDISKLGQVFPEQIPVYRTQMLKKYFLDAREKRRQEIRERQVQTLEKAYADFCKAYGFKLPSGRLEPTAYEDDDKDESEKTIEDKMCDIVDKYGLVC